GVFGIGAKPATNHHRATSRTADGAALRPVDEQRVRVAPAPRHRHPPTGSRRVQLLEPAGGISRGQGPGGEPFRFLLPTDRLTRAARTGPRHAQAPTTRNTPAASSTAGIQRLERNTTAVVMPGRLRPTHSAGCFSKRAWAMARPPILVPKAKNRNFKIICPALRSAASPEANPPHPNNAGTGPTNHVRVSNTRYVTRPV